jgi:glycyl-tRNA synthetase
MHQLYERNGLIFWTEKEIRLREMMMNHFVDAVKTCLESQNRAWEFVRVEAPLLTPRKLLNKNYTNEDIFAVDRPTGENPIWDNLVLRPETTMGSYAMAQHLLTAHNKIRLPLCVWQHGKSFRNEQDQPTKFMRLKEFYQLEFQCIYSVGTKADYAESLIPTVRDAIAEMIGPCRVEDSDRIPDYAEWTRDVVCMATDMELCSISLRKDYPEAVVLEVAIGMDRCVYNFGMTRAIFED